ncbi:MAG: helix-turn-helix domain-containing protein [Xanthomonadaceae bacterium]|nr:helix-turn-helix domain-containing protein [Xanthomonadaceae bacterium]
MQNAVVIQTPYSRTIADAANAIGIGKSTLWRLIAKGEIKAFPVGRRTLITEEEIKRFVREKSEAANA